MNPQTFVFIGSSGCGKGTQAALLEEKLRVKSPETKIIHLETGKIFREFINGPKYTHQLSKKIYDDGGLQPEFLTVNLWSNFFIENMEENVHLIIDGTPRKIHEAKILHTAFEYYQRSKPNIIFLNVSREWSEEKLLARKRLDDNKHDIKARLDWFETEVMPTINYYRQNSFYNFLDINGQANIDEIHQDIVRKLGLG